MKKVLLVLLILALSYGLTLHMYFWQDDSALLFKLQHPYEQMGSFGADIIGSGAYKYLVTPFVVFFPLFGLQPFGYFFIGLVTYGIAAWCLYFFTKELLQSKKGAYFSTLIFSAGYVASDTMFRVINSWQTNVGLSLALFCLYFLAKYHNLRRSLFYWLSLIFFLVSVEFVFVRSHSFVFAVFILDLLFTLKHYSIKNIAMFFVRQIPFWIVFWSRYVAGDGMGSGSMENILSQLTKGNIEVFSALLATVGNAFVPNHFQNGIVQQFSTQSMRICFVFFALINVAILRKSHVPKKYYLISISGIFFSYLLNKYFISLNLYWYRSVDLQLSGLLGLLIITTSIVWSLGTYQRNKTLALAIIFSVFVVISQVFGYFIQYPEAIFTTTHRYLSHAVIGTAVFFGVITYFLYEKLLVRSKFISLIPMILVLSVYLMLGRDYQQLILKNRSIPTQQFYKDLQKYVPHVSRGDVFYFDVKDSAFFQNQFNDFFSVGSMPETTAIALYYGVDRYDISRFLDYEEFISHIAQTNNNFYSFYYGSEGLVNTTQTLHEALQGNANPNPVSKLLCLAQVKPKAKINKRGGEDLLIKNAIQYLSNRREYYESVHASASSEWRYQEIENLIDQNIQTSWRGHRLIWLDKHEEQVTLDLGALKTVDALIWQNWNHTLTPTEYVIETSTNQVDWQSVLSREGVEREDGERVIDTFSPTTARYVRMKITKTVTNDSPALSEIQVIEAKDNVDVEFLDTLLANPEAYLSESNVPKIISFLPVLLTIETDDGKKTGQAFLQSLHEQELEFVIPSGGTKIKSMSIQAPRVIEFVEEKIACRNLSLVELKSRNFVKRFVEN